MLGRRHVNHAAGLARHGIHHGAIRLDFEGHGLSVLQPQGNKQFKLFASAVLRKRQKSKFLQRAEKHRNGGLLLRPVNGSPKSRSTFGFLCLSPTKL